MAFLARLNLKSYIRTRVRYRLIRIIIHRHFRFRHRRGELRVIHQHLPPLINLPRLIESLKRPPHALHKILIHSSICPLKIHPSSNSFNRLLPSLRIRYHRLTRLQNIIFQRPLRPNLSPVRNPKLLLYKILRR